MWTLNREGTMRKLIVLALLALTLFGVTAATAAAHPTGYLPNPGPTTY